MSATLKSSHPLYPELVAAGITEPGTITARETRDGVAWLVVEFAGYGTVSAPASEFDEV